MKVRWILILAPVLSMILTACGAPAGSDPIVLFEAFETAWNAKDLDAAMEFIADDAVEKNGLGTFTGKESIRNVYRSVIDRFSMDCDNFQVDGNTVTMDCVLTPYDGTYKAGETYESVVEDGKIKSNTLIRAFTPK